MEKLVLTNFQSPGDVLMLTAAVRDLHVCHPGRYQTDVRSSCPSLWENNPHLTPLDTEDPATRVLSAQYPLIHESNQRPVHFLEGFIDHLNQQLDLKVRLTRGHGDIHLSREEKSRPSRIRQITGADLPCWIIVAGGKYDFTIKWWHFRRWQAVVDHFRGRLLFVQVGEANHYHPLLDGVLDLRGRTNLRELVQLVYHSSGALCPVTLVMHLAAAVEVKSRRFPSRPCVVVAGGRESPSWESYANHQFLHTVGALPCCAQGGCWRSRVVPLGDGDEKDRAEHLCVDVVNGLPHCMDLITAEQVCERIELFVSGRQSMCLSRRQAARAEPHLSRRAREFRGGA